MHPKCCPFKIPMASCPYVGGLITQTLTIVLGGGIRVQAERLEASQFACLNDSFQVCCERKNYAWLMLDLSITRHVLLLRQKS